jgi:hypothetical protein
MLTSKMLSSPFSLQIKCKSVRCSNASMAMINLAIVDERAQGSSWVSRRTADTRREAGVQAEIFEEKPLLF